MFHPLLEIINQTPNYLETIINQQLAKCHEVSFIVSCLYLLKQLIYSLHLINTFVFGILPMIVCDSCD